MNKDLIVLVGMIRLLSLLQISNNIRAGYVSHPLLLSPHEHLILIDSLKDKPYSIFPVHKYVAYLLFQKLGFQETYLQFIRL